MAITLAITVNTGTLVSPPYFTNALTCSTSFMSTTMSRSLLSMMVRRVSTTSSTSSVSAASLAEKAVEQSPGLRLAPAQAARMDDLGTRDIFSPEQDMFRESGEGEEGAFCQ